MAARTTLNQPSAMQNAPPAPRGFDADAKALWTAIVASRPVPTWTASDLRLLSMYVEACSDVARLTREIDDEGEVIGMKVSPRIKIRAAREQFLITLAMKLRLTPSNRWDSKAVHRMGEHATRASRALSNIDADDLLGGVPTKRRNLQ
jgi:phage terminase small subunit